MLQTYYPTTEDGAAHFTDQQCAQTVTKDGLTIDSVAAEALVAYGLLRVGDPTKKSKQPNVPAPYANTDGVTVPSFNPLDGSAPNAPAFPANYTDDDADAIAEAQSDPLPAADHQTSKGD